MVLCSILPLALLSFLEADREGLARVSAEGDGVGKARVCISPFSCTSLGGKAWTCSHFLSSSWFILSRFDHGSLRNGMAVGWKP